MYSTATNCPNCGLHSTGKFCSACGEKLNVEPIRFKSLFLLLFNGILSFEFPFFKTLKALAIKPVHFIHNYIAGIRKGFSNPIQFVLISLAVYFLLRTITGFDPVDMEFVARGVEPPSIEQQDPSLKAGYFISRNVNYLIFIFLIIHTAFAALFFRRSKYKTAEHLTMTLYTFGLHTIITLALIGLSFLHPKLYRLNLVVMFLLYTIISCRFHEQYRWHHYLKSALLFFLSFVCYVVLIFAIVIKTKLYDIL